MKPIKIEFQAFGPYIGYESVDFENLAKKGLFLICGRTGIGKTMILDAMTFALYGRSSGHGRDDFEAMRCTNADFDTTTFVKFEFEAHGEYYLFERRLERKRKNLSPSYNVAKRGEDGIYYPLMENPKDKAVNEKAVELIGLEYEQFRQVIVLPQGQFERLLTSNSEDKEKILTSIFGEEKWDKIARCFFDKVDKRWNELKEIRTRIQGSLQEEDCDSIEALQDLISGLDEELLAVDKEYQRGDYGTVISKQQEALNLVNRFNDLHRAKERLVKLEEHKEERTGWERILEESTRASKVGPILEEEENLSNVLRRRIGVKVAAEEALERIARTWESAKKAEDEYYLKEEEIQKLRIKSVQYSERRSGYEGLDEINAKVKESRGRLEEAKREEADIASQDEALKGKIAALQIEFARLQTEHSELLNEYLSGITGELASKLLDGQPCPVCGSCEHPHKAECTQNSITKTMVDEAKHKSDKVYAELQTKLDRQATLKRLLDEKHKAMQEVALEVNSYLTRFENMKEKLVPGITSLKELDAQIRRLNAAVMEYEDKKALLEKQVEDTGRAYTEAKTKIAAAQEEVAAANRSLEEIQVKVSLSLQENGFESREQIRRILLNEELGELSRRIADYDASVSSAKENLFVLQKELEGRTEPDEEECRQLMQEANQAEKEYLKARAVLTDRKNRLSNKLKELNKLADGLEEELRRVEEEHIFAKKLRGDTGIGLQRYVLGILFSSVITAANRMLEMVHGGRYRLFRSDDKSQGNKRGLELKVYDRNSEEHDGRFVSTLSGGEKFLVSLALSIGMSTVAQKSGIRIEALFIDEGFGSLDEESIIDAMSILNSIQEANGLVGIISHVQLLQDQIPSKLMIEQSGKGSHIVQSIG